MHYEGWLLMLKLYWNYWLFCVNNSCIPKYQHQIDIDIFYALNVRIGIRSVAKKWHLYITIDKFCTLVII